jgi:hypothetical protein
VLVEKDITIAVMACETAALLLAMGPAQAMKRSSHRRFQKNQAPSPGC